MKPPHNVTYLERALRRMAGADESLVQLRRTIANVVAGQFLDGAVMRGGGALKLRYGAEATRYTTDFDAARRVDEEEFRRRYSAALAKGWGEFSGRLAKVSKPRPANVPEEYVMQPFEVKLAYRNQPWCTVDLEVSYNETGDADECDLVAPPEGIVRIFRELGLPEPSPVPLMRVVHQMAQKLHGLTDRDYSRVQDLIDLQLIAARESVDFAEVNGICARLFANRRKQSWPSFVEAGAGWEEAYGRLRGGLPVIEDFGEAVEWVNGLIRAIAEMG